MRRPLVMWVAGISPLVVLDIWASYNDIEGDSLSEVIRDVWQTATPAGRVRFLLTYAAFSAWFIPHINRKVQQ
jgi:hypothetical protein